MELGLCIEMTFTRDPVAERMRKAAAAGLRNVELWFVDGTWKGSPVELAAAARAAGVRITNTVIGSPDGAIGGGLTDPSHRGQWLERTGLTLDFNVRAGIPATIVCTGNAPAVPIPPRCAGRSWRDWPKQRRWRRKQVSRFSWRR
jgi:sugar phosphate isomerase/epimerase